MTLLRHPVKPEDFHRGYDDSLVNDACNTLYGIGDRALVLDAMVERFARVLNRVKDGDTGTTNTVLANFVRDTDGAAQAAIMAGQFEVARTQWYENIVTESSNLFGQSSNGFEYSIPTASEVIEPIREASGSALSAQRWDMVSNGVKSCPLYIEMKGTRLVETEVRPNALWIIFADSITENGKNRATDTMGLDEASCVIMQLAGHDQYAAWWGPSEDYPNGRHCVFTAKKFSDVPEPEDKDGREFTIQGEYSEMTVGVEMLANPLTLWSIDSDVAPPVYPFSILYGSDRSTGILPVSTSLYEQCLEYDLTASLILGASGRGARGARVLSQTGDADPGDVSDNMGEGDVLLGRNKELNFAGWSPTHAAAAYETLKNLARATAEANSVPGDMAVRGDQSTIESGYHYRLKLDKLIDHRTKRISMNRASVKRRWEIEKALINATTYTKKSDYTIPGNTDEMWKPGDYDILTSPEEERAELEWQLKNGIASSIDLVMSRRGYKTAAQAIEWMTAQKELRETNAEVLDYFKPSAAPAAAPARGGLFGGRQ